MVTTNLLDLRTQPSHAAERASQLFFGQPVKITSTRQGFARVRQLDGYAGWVDARFLTEIARSGFDLFHSRVNAVISRTNGAACLDRAGRNIPPHLLLYGTLVRAGRPRDGLTKLELPDGSGVFVKSATVRPISKTGSGKLTGPSLLTEARKFLGAPYLWGGISPLGFDCSGLVQTLLARFGIAMPRDTRLQIAVGREVERVDIRTGDLLFFDRHVGLAIGPHRLLHASRGGGGVRINSLRSGLPDYRADLDRDFNLARKIL